jgi:hypothetical protein
MGKYIPVHIVGKEPVAHFPLLYNINNISKVVLDKQSVSRLYKLKHKQVPIETHLQGS